MPCLEGLPETTDPWTRPSLTNWHHPLMVTLRFDRLQCSLPAYLKMRGEGAGVCPRQLQSCTTTAPIVAHCAIVCERLAYSYYAGGKGGMRCDRTR